MSQLSKNYINNFDDEDFELDENDEISSNIVEKVKKNISKKIRKKPLCKFKKNVEN